MKRILALGSQMENNVIRLGKIEGQEKQAPV